jgi:hypothetical protein
VQTESDTKALEFTLALKQKPVRLGQRDFGKTNDVASAKLYRDAKIDGDHVRDFRVTADWLAISQK